MGILRRFVWLAPVAAFLIPFAVIPARVPVVDIRYSGAPSVVDVLPTTPESPQEPQEEDEAPVVPEGNIRSVSGNVEAVAPVLEAPAPQPVTAPAGPWTLPLDGLQTARPAPLGGYICFGPYGYPLPQDSETCPPGYAGRPPEHPLHVG